ncbi:MAG: tetratricopeptide repeat protein [bacterium]
MQDSLNRLYEAKLDSGFRCAPLYALLCLREAYRCLEEGDPATAGLFGETAGNLAPGLPQTSLFLSSLARRDSRQGFARSLYWAVISFRDRMLDFDWQFRTAAKLFVLAVASLYALFLLQGPYLLMRHGAVGAHALRERLRMEKVAFLPVGALIAALLVAAFFLLGPFWAVVLVGFALGIHSRLWERMVFLALLSVWAFSPWIVNLTTRFLQPLPGAVQALEASLEGDWNAAAQSALDETLREEPDSADLLWTAALVAKRQGRYDEAEAFLRRALEVHPRHGALWNNLGNLFAIRGSLEEAKDAYEQAIASAANLASPHYNLSQALRREFSFLRGAAEFQAARRLDPRGVDFFVYNQSLQPNRVFMDEEPGSLSLWLQLARGRPTARVADDLWLLAGARVPVRAMPLLAAGTGFLYALLILSGRMKSRAHRCVSCGRISCARCQPATLSREICHPCYQVLYQREQIPKEHRQRQVRYMAQYQRKRLRSTLLWNAVLPGFGWAVARERARGMVVFFALSVCALGVLCWERVLPAGPSGWAQGGGGFRCALLVLFVASYLGVQYAGLRRFRQRR